GSILSKMDRAVSPCDDFYGFSCGGWLRDNPIPEDSSSYGIYPWLRQHVDITLKELLETPSDSDEIEAVRKAKVFYRSCMDEGRWDLLQTLAQIRNQHSKSVLIRLYIAPDDKNSTNYIIKVAP
ncbi:unnamed protein product, partial [Coregonus sp. 'balchen']